MAGHLLFNSGSNESTLAPQFKWLDNTFKSDLQRGFVVDDVGRNAPAVPGPGLALGVRLTRLATLYCSLLPEIQILYVYRYLKADKICVNFSSLALS